MEPNTDGRKARGAASRARVLHLAGDMATLKGLDGLTLGSLGKELNISPSNVHSLFGGSKLELQLATVAAARERFIAAVVEPVHSEPDGLRMLDALLTSWLKYVDDDIFAGGCFVLHGLHEYGPQDGPIRNALMDSWHGWMKLLERHVKRAHAKGELDVPDVDQAVFEISALLIATNSYRQMGDPGATDKGRRALSDFLRRYEPRA